MSNRRLVEQFVTFYFAINNLPVIDNDENEASYLIWKQAVKLLEERHHAHPRRTFTEPDDRYEMTHIRWELCDQSAEVEERHRLAAWPLTFYNGTAIDLETLLVLRDLCTECFNEAAAAAAGTAHFLDATAQSHYTESQTELVEGL